MLKLSDKTRKKLGFTCNIVANIIIVLSIILMLFTTFSLVISPKNGSETFIFGYKFYIVKSDSMSATDFDSGDLICIKRTDPKKLEVGDIISYTSLDSDNYGSVITHKIREKKEVSEGVYQFITYGTTTNTNDISEVTEEQIIGKYVNSFPGLGEFFMFLRTKTGYICFIFIPLILVIAYFAYGIIKMYKKDKPKEIEINMTQEEMSKEIEELKRKVNEVENKE